MSTATMTSAYRSESLVTLLGPIHKAWIEEARRFLEPALQPGADFWDRWAAVRYIANDFQEHSQRERALVDELRSFLPLPVGERLLREGDRVMRVRLELDRIGRRRGTAAQFAAGGRDLLRQLGLWFSEIEYAVRGLSRDALNPEGADLLADLETALVTDR